VVGSETNRQGGKTLSVAVVENTLIQRPDARSEGSPPELDISETVLRIAAEVAKEVHGRYWRYPQHIELADLAQVAAEWSLINYDRVLEYQAMEPDQANALIAVGMRRHLHRYAEGERTVAEGGPAEWRPRYTIEQIEFDLLPAIFHRHLWNRIPSETAGDYTDAREWIVALADCADAFGKLDSVTREVLERKYRDGEEVPAIAAAVGLGERGVSRLLNRGAARIHQELGGPDAIDEDRMAGHRRALSNAVAQAVAGNAYEGE
jgi:DNA-directed RNA polymerase specialized sigma24 family protein